MQQTSAMPPTHAQSTKRERERKLLLDGLHRLGAQKEDWEKRKGGHVHTTRTPQRPTGVGCPARVSRRGAAVVRVPACRHRAKPSHSRKTRIQNPARDLRAPPIPCSNSTSVGPANTAASIASFPPPLPHACCSPRFLPLAWPGAQSGCVFVMRPQLPGNAATARFPFRQVDEEREQQEDEEEEKEGGYLSRCRLPLAAALFVGLICDCLNASTRATYFTATLSFYVSW